MKDTYTVELTREMCVGLRACVSTNESRPLLCNAYVEPMMVTATNGHIVVRYEISPTEDDMVTPGDGDGYALPPQALAAVKVGQALRLELVTGGVSVVDKWGKVAATLPSMERGKSPDIEKIIPREDTVARFLVTREVLESLCKVTRKDTHPITIELIDGLGDDHAARGLRFRDEGGGFSGVFMPCRDI